MDDSVENGKHSSELNLETVFETYRKANIDLWKRFDENADEDLFVLEIDGKAFRRPPSPIPKNVDFGVHTCGARSAPNFLEESYFQRNWTSYVEWSEAQLALIRSRYSEIKWNFNLFNSAKEQAKNCWPSFLKERAWYEHIKKSQGSHNLQLGDVLNFLSSEWDLAVESISSSPVMEGLKQRTPYDAKTGISVNIFNLQDVYPELNIRNRFIKDIVDDLSGTMDAKEVEEIAIQAWQEMEQRNQSEVEILKLNGVVEEVNNVAPAVSAKIFEYFCEDFYECDHFDDKHCEICTTSFYPQTQESWPYLLPPEFCDFCVKMVTHQQYPDFFEFGFTAEQIKAQMIFGVRNFFQIFGYIPVSGQNRAKTILKSLRSLNFELNLPVILKSVAILPPKELVEKHFKSWSHLLAEADLLELTNRGKGGYRSVASDGHLCLSLGERTICEFLFKLNIEHSKEPLYPKHTTLNPNHLMRADFEIQGIYVEFAGMMGNPEYATRMKNKQELARIKKIPWIKLESAEDADLARLREFITKSAAKRKI